MSDLRELVSWSVLLGAALALGLVDLLRLGRRLKRVGSDEGRGVEGHAPAASRHTR